LKEILFKMSFRFTIFLNLFLITVPKEVSAANLKKSSFTTYIDHINLHSGGEPLSG
jgi:hypothetical protein